MRQLGPNRFATFLNLLPVLTTTSAPVLLGEPVRLFHVVGGGLTPASIASAGIPAAVGKAEGL